MLKVNNVIRLCLFADTITKRIHGVTLYKVGTKTKVIAAIIPIIMLGLTIWWYLEYQDRVKYRSFSTQMIKGDCFGVDAQWTDENLLLNDPKIFGSSA
jgi:hypothetical protein